MPPGPCPRAIQPRHRRPASATMADVSIDGETEATPVRIELSVEPGPPPSGVVAIDGGAERRFEGWLGLLRLLDDAFDAEAPAGPAGSLGGESAPGVDAELGEGV